MNQGGYGSGGPGGGWGPPPGGGGYGPPPGAPPPGYGQPPGYGPPPGGYPGPGMQPNAYPPPTGGDGGAGRFLKTAVVGGLVGGVLSSIPLLKVLNCCFCLLNMIGAAVGVSMYLKEHPGEKISSGDAAVSGAISGGIAGLIAGVVGFIISLATTSLVLGLMRNMPTDVRGPMMGLAAGGGVFGIFLSPFLYAGLGALGGFLSMQLFFKDRLKG